MKLSSSQLSDIDSGLKSSQQKSYLMYNFFLKKTYGFLCFMLVVLAKISSFQCNFLKCIKFQQKSSQTEVRAGITQVSTSALKLTNSILHCTQNNLQIARGRK